MAPVALTKLATRLRCPTCGGPLEVAAQALACAQGHSFDIARQGYVALCRPHVKGAAGDTPAMVAAREAFLAAGYYQPIARALAAAAGRGLDVGGRGRDGAGQTEVCVVDLGAGTGDQLSRLLDRFRGAWGIALGASRAPADGRDRLRRVAGAAAGGCERRSDDQFVCAAQRTGDRSCVAPAREADRSQAGARAPAPALVRAGDARRRSAQGRAAARPAVHGARRGEPN